jgi:sporulation protein YlmC with PRC-barrel domain
MLMIMIARLVGTIYIIFLAGGIASSADKPRTVRSAVRNYQFTILKGMSVENNDGERLGTVADFVLDLQSGHVKFGIVKSGGFRPFSEQKIVPGFCLLLSIKENTLALDVNSARWSKAPGFDRGHLKDLSDPARKKQIAEFYHCPDEIAEKQTSSIKTLSQTGRQGPAGLGKGETLMLASDLMGRELVNGSRQSMGKISNLILDTTQRKDTFAIFATGF